MPNPEDICGRCLNARITHYGHQCPDGKGNWVDRPPTTTFEGGAQRDKEEIPAYSLIPHSPLKRVAQRYHHGSVKYGPRNWEAGDQKFRDDCLNRADEHYHKYCSGDRSEDHLAASIWNLMAVMFFEDKDFARDLVQGAVPQEVRDECPSTLH